MNKRQIGENYERKAADFLETKGYEILQSNYRCRIGEIDLIARDGGYLVFVEVKYRATNQGGSPLQAVNWKKQRTICKVADYYLLVHNITRETPCRFDVIGIQQDEIVHVEHAFEYIGL